MRAAVLLLALAVPAAALDGTVANSVTGAPVKKASVTVRSRAATYSAVSDASGRWSIPVISDGDYDVVVECQGFLPPSARLLPIRVPDDASVALELTPLAVIAGKALDEEGDPLPNVTLSAMAYDYSRPAPSLRAATTAVSDDRGEFRLFDLKPGRYYVQAVAPDRTLPVLFHPAATEVAQAAPVDLPAGAEATGVDIRMKRVPLFRIRGTLVDVETGKPLRAVIIADALASSAPRYSAQVPFNGAFEFPAVQPGTYTLTVTQTAGPHEMFGEQVVSVSDRDVEDAHLAATPVADVRGSLVIEGPPRVGSLAPRVTLEPLARPGFSVSASPKDDGSFTITAGPLLFALNVAGIPADLYLRKVHLGGEDATSGRIDLTRGPAPLILTFAPNPGRLSGVVQTSDGRPCAGVPVAITPADAAIVRGDLTRTIYTDAEGHFSAGSLAPGDYGVYAWEQYDAGLAGSLQARRLLAAKGATVTVRAGSEENVRLQPVAPADIDAVRRRIP